MVFSSDFHLFHKNVIKFDNRPFLTEDGEPDVMKMNEEIVDRWNQVVDDDTVAFFLGDFCFRGFGHCNEWANRLNGKKIYFILGNHDQEKHIRKCDRFEDVFSYGLDLKIKDEDNKQGYQRLVLSHYPIYSWNHKPHGSWMVHGHCHHNIKEFDDNGWYFKHKIMDVGCNGNNFFPHTYQEVKSFMQERETKII